MQKINISMLPNPTHVIKTNSFTIFQWGWIGFSLTQNALVQLEFNIDKVLDYIINNSEGVYFIIIQDVINDKCIFFSDRLSCKKIFYYLKDDELYFSDFLYKYKPLLNTDFKLDHASVGFYLLYGHIATNDTLYKSIKSVKPFTYYIYKDNQLKEHRYYEIDFIEEEISYHDALIGTLELLEQSFLDLTKNYRHFLIPLSGGRDSRFLLALAIKHFSSDRITTFTFGQKGSLDFEIGTGLSKRLGVKSVVLPYDVNSYFDTYISLSTRYKNGLINHSVDSPSKLYEKILGDNLDTLIISGYAGDAVLAWLHGKSLLETEEKFLYPEPKYFNYQLIETCLSDFKEEFIERVKDVVNNLFDRKGNFEKEKWAYLNHLPCYVNSCLFSEEQMYPFALPFIKRGLFDWIKKVPARYKKKVSFYEDVVKRDKLVYSVFRYPLKKFKGALGERNRVRNLLLKTQFATKAIINRAWRNGNYINFKRAYQDKFLKKEISFLHQYQFLYPILENLEKLSFDEKCLLFSLKVNLEYFF